MIKTNKNNNGFTVVEVLLVLIALALIGLAGYFVAKHVNNNKSPANGNSIAAASTNTWTGKDNNYNWNDANNWSLGIPTNNQILEINVAKVKLPVDGTEFEFQDNIPNLTIYKLVIDGQATNNVGFNIKGSP